MKQLFIKYNYMSPNQLKRQPCEVYSRVVGYLRPVKQWNNGKKTEFHDRVTYDATTTTCC